MLTVIGECLVDVVETGSAPARAHVGGSPLNVAVGLARLGHGARFIGRYGRDEYGQMIHRHLGENSVLAVLPADDRSTSVATAVLDPSGSARYTFDLDWELPGLDAVLPAVLASTELLHTGSIATMLEPGAAAVLHTVERAHPTATISFDPNCRPTLITDREYARPRTERFVALSDVVKASDEDLRWLYPGRSVEATARAWLATGPSMVVVTRGSHGPWAVVAAGEAAVDAPVVEVVDTVGAGDSFMAGLLGALADRELVGSGRRDRLRSLSVETLQELLGYAARCAALTVSRAGANPPTRAELQGGGA